MTPGLEKGTGTEQTQIQGHLQSNTPPATGHTSGSLVHFLPVPPPHHILIVFVGYTLDFLFAVAVESVVLIDATRTWSQVSRSFLGFPRAFISLCYKRERTPHSLRGYHGGWLRSCTCGHLAQGLALEWFAQNTSPPPL